ncbi:glycosyltransferase domain-containing protein [Thiolapillus sp.]
MKALVYTCVLDAYDRVFPPLEPEPGLDYLIVTDDPGLSVDGWRTLTIDAKRFTSVQQANRYYKMLMHRELPGYACSLYIDGNIRLLGRTSEVLEGLVASGAALGVFAHPLRSRVADEIKACVQQGKTRPGDKTGAEMDYYRQHGFTDDAGLVEAGILLKNHLHPGLDRAMRLWWALYRRFGSRDQISLPYVLWRTSLPVMIQSYSFRQSNAWFGLYAHRKDPRASRHYAYVQARAYDSMGYRALLSAWHASWRLRRALRRLRRESRV